MRKLAGFAAAGCLLLMALSCGACVVFAGGDVGPLTTYEGSLVLTVKLLIALVAAGLMLAAMLVAVLALRTKDAPRRRLSRAQLLLAYRDQSRRKRDYS
jgi:hypothetical protein